MKRALVTTISAALLSSAAAQEIATSLPLTSVGNKLMWTIGDQDLKLVVATSSHVKLDVYGAQFDPQDYRSRDFFGDENYSTERPKSPVSSTFELTDAKGKVVKTRTFGAGQQDWQTFLDQEMAAGTYTLRVRTVGNAKNTFAMRLNSVSAAVQADHLNVTIRSNDWVPALNVYNPGGKMTVKMYDGDGPTELEAQLRNAQGQIYPIKVSGQLQWQDIKVPEDKGNYTLFLRQPKNTYQFSNSVGFQLASGPITVVKTERTGKLDIVAELILPNEVLPTQATVRVGERTYQVNGKAGPYGLPTQEYPVTVDPITGAVVTLDKDRVEVINDQIAHIKVQVRPDVALAFKANKPEVCVGDVVKFTAEASTKFERQKLPASIRVALPQGFTANGESSVTARVDAANPSQLVFEAKAAEAGDQALVAKLLPWNKQQEVSVKVLPAITSLELRRSDLPATTVGETITVSLNIRNTSRAAMPYALTDQVGAGLEALDSTSFSGVLQPGESKALQYRVRVKEAAADQATLNATLKSDCGSPQALTGLIPIKAPVAPVVVTERESVVRLPFDAPRAAKEAIIAHELPTGATYVQGSSTLNGKVVADPLVGPSGKHYWFSQNIQRGILTYKVTHQKELPALAEPTLVAKYRKGMSEVLVGDSKLDDLDALQATAGKDMVFENKGQLKLPANGQIYRDRDRMTVVVSGEAKDTSLPVVNGVAVQPKSLGKKVMDQASGTLRREFYGIQLKNGENTIQYGDETVKVYLASTPVKAKLTAQQLVADGTTPIQVGVELLDAQGLSNGSNVTVRTTLEPTKADAKPIVGSYQIKLVDGQGVLELQPMSVPTRFDVEVLVGDKVVKRSFESVPSKTRVGIGMLSAGAMLTGNEQGGAAYAGELRANGYYETPLGDGKLYVAGSAALKGDTDEKGEIFFENDPDQGLPNTANPLERYPNYGDSSKHETPLQGIDPVAFRYEHPQFNVQYRRAALPIDVFNTGINPTALSGFSRGSTQVSGFAAALPSKRVEIEVAANGSRILALENKGGVLADSEVVELVTIDSRTGAKRYTKLQPLVHYTMDYLSGVIYFQRPVDFVDKDGNAQAIRVNYHLVDATQQRKLAAGVQVGTRLLNDTLKVGAAVVHLDDVTSFGVRGRYSDNGRNADLLAAYSGEGMLVTGSGDIKVGQVEAKASVHYQSAEYKGLNAANAGMALDSEVKYNLNHQLHFSVAGRYKQTPETATVKETSGGSVDFKVGYNKLPFTVSGGLRTGFGNQEGMAALVGAGYEHQGLKASVDHVQPVTGEQKAKTKLKVAVPVRENVQLTATDDIVWGVGHQASVGLQSRLGMTNLSVAYDLPGADGWGNRARFGMDTRLPINERFTADVTGSYIAEFDKEHNPWNVGAGVKYKDTQLAVTLASDFTHQKEGFTVGLRGGAAYSLNDRITLSAEGTQIFGPKKYEGSNYALSATLRASEWQGLTYIRYKDGALAAQKPEVIGEANLEYHVPTYALRGGLATRALLNQPGSLTYQASASGTYYLNDRIGLGLAGRALVQPATGYNGYSFGLEGSWRALPGTWLTVGYNPVGFKGIGSNLYTRQGAYMRIDMMFDDGQANDAPHSDLAAKKGRSPLSQVASIKQGTVGRTLPTKGSKTEGSGE